MNRFSTIWVVAAGFLMAYWGIGQGDPSRLLVESSELRIIDTPSQS